MFKIINKICPESLLDQFAERSTVGKYGTRNKTDLQILRLNLDFSRNFFNDTGLKTWKSIPTHMRESNTLTRFKNGLMTSCSKLKEKILNYSAHESKEEQYWLFLSVYLTYSLYL